MRLCPRFKNFTNIKDQVDEIIILGVLLDYHMETFIIQGECNELKWNLRISYSSNEIAVYIIKFIYTIDLVMLGATFYKPGFRIPEYYRDIDSIEHILNQIKGEL